VPPTPVTSGNTTCGERLGLLRIASGGARIARRVEDGDPLGVGLLRHGTEERRRKIDFTVAVAGADNLSHIEINSRNHGCERAGSVDVEYGRLGRNRAGPFQIQVAFYLRSVETGVRTGVWDHYGIVGRQIVARTKRLQIAQQDSGFTNDRNALA
jgi:hypothetical protein